jgi:hypothetical protein
MLKHFPKVSRNMYCAIIVILHMSMFQMVSAAGGGSVPTARADTPAVSITYDEELLYYKVEFDLTVVSHKEMGRQYAEAIKATLPNFEVVTDKFLQDEIAAVEGMGLVFSDPSDELGNGRLSPNKIFVNLIFEDVMESSACSTSAVFGALSETGKTIVGRNNDWTPNEEMDKWNALFIFHNGEKSSGGNGSIGELFPNNVFNRHHVFGASLDSYPGKKPFPLQEGMRSPTVDLRYAMETNQTLGDAENYLLQCNYSNGTLILLADTETAHVMEYDISRSKDKRARLRNDTSKVIRNGSLGVPNAIACVNSFLLPGSFRNHARDDHNKLRYNNFQKLFGGCAKQGKIGVEQMQGIMGYTSWDGNSRTSGAIYRLGIFDPTMPEDEQKDNATYQSLVMKLDTFETWLAYSSDGARWPYTPKYHKVLEGDPFK